LTIKYIEDCILWEKIEYFKATAILIAIMGRRARDNELFNSPQSPMAKKTKAIGANCPSSVGHDIINMTLLLGGSFPLWGPQRYLAISWGPFFFASILFQAFG